MTTSNRERCRIIQISKRNGSFRTIYVPDAKYKAELREYTGRLERKARQLDKDNISHGFTRFRSPATNAAAHIGHAFTLSVDLKDFFDCVTDRQLAGKLSKEELATVLVEGVGRQGLPTSPAVANIAFSDCDKAILKFLRKAGKNVIYTRYADDLTFSFDQQGLEQIILPRLKQILAAGGFRLNDKKTQLQKASDGRRHVTGIAVDEAGIHPTRKMKRRLRAALHQKKESKARGLSEWCACKMPRSRDSIVGRNTEDELDTLRKRWKLPKIRYDLIPQRSSSQLNDNVTISADPAMYLGMSTFTSGWRSCMTQPTGQYRRGVMTWLYLEGTRVAYFAKPDDLVTFHGVSKPRMLARCLVHELRDGRMVYDRLYGNEVPVADLINSLRAAGLISIQEAKGQGCDESRVKGNVPAGVSLAYCDTLKHHKAIDKSTKKSVLVFTL